MKGLPDGPITTGRWTSARNLSRPTRQVEMRRCIVQGRWGGGSNSSGLRFTLAPISSSIKCPMSTNPVLGSVPGLMGAGSRLWEATISATKMGKTQKQKPTQILSQEGNADGGRESREASFRWWGKPGEPGLSKEREEEGGTAGDGLETWLSRSVQGLGFMRKWDWWSWEARKQEAGHISCETLSDRTAFFLSFFTATNIKMTCPPNTVEDGKMNWLLLLK